MSARYMDLRQDDKCGSDTRGLVVWSDERERWETWRLPLEDSDLPPCQGRLQSELKVLPDQELPQMLKRPRAMTGRTHHPVPQAITQNGLPSGSARTMKSASSGYSQSTL